MARKKPGPPKIKNVMREPNGRTSRAVDAEKIREEAVMRQAVENRMKLWAIKDPKKAADPLAATVIGRLRLNWSTHQGADNSRAIDIYQHDALAGLWTLRQREKWAVESSKGIVSPGFEMVSRGLSALHEFNEEDHTKRVNAILSRYADVRGVVRDAIGLVGWDRVYRIVCEDQPVLHDADIAFLRCAANEINRLWNGRKRAA